MKLRLLSTTACVAALCVVLTGCASAPKGADGKMRFVVVDASGGG